MFILLSTNSVAISVLSSKLLKSSCESESSWTLLCSSAFTVCSSSLSDCSSSLDDSNSSLEDCSSSLEDCSSSLVVLSSSLVDSSSSVVVWWLSRLFCSSRSSSAIRRCSWAVSSASPPLPSVKAGSSGAEASSNTTKRYPLSCSGSKSG